MIRVTAQMCNIESLLQFDCNMHLIRALLQLTFESKCIGWCWFIILKNKWNMYLHFTLIQKEHIRKTLRFLISEFRDQLLWILAIWSRIHNCALINNEIILVGNAKFLSIYLNWLWTSFNRIKVSFREDQSYCKLAHCKIFFTYYSNVQENKRTVWPGMCYECPDKITKIIKRMDQ